MKKEISLAGFTIPRIGYGTPYLPKQRGFGPARGNAGELLQTARELGARFYYTTDS